MSAAIGLDLTKNLSYHTIPAAFFACVLPHFVAVGGAGKIYDNAYPRSLTESVEKSDTLDKEAKARVARAQAASDNGFETIGLYAAAVVAANHAGVDACTLNWLTLGYVATRYAYVFAYVQLGANRKLSGVRSGVWMAGIGAIMTLFVKAGNKICA